MHIDHIETPAAIVDLDLLESHIARFQAYLDQHGIANRPHIKTHKIPAIAQMQVAAGGGAWYAAMTRDSKQSIVSSQHVC